MISLVSSFPTNMKILLKQKTLEKQKLIFSRSALFHMKTRVSLKYFGNDCGLRHGSFYNLTEFLGKLGMVG